MTVLGRVERVREVVVGNGQTTVPDLAAHEVVLDVALAVAPGEGAVLILAEAHHNAGAVDVVIVEDCGRIHVPAKFALRIVDGVLRVAVPFERAAHRVVPDGAGRFRRRGDHVVDEIEAVRESRIHLLHLCFREDGSHARIAGGADVRRARINAVGLLLNALRLAVGVARVGNLNRVAVVRIETEDGDAAVRAHLRVAHLVLDFLTAFLRNNAHRHIGERVAAILNYGGERSEFVRVEDDCANLARCRVAHVRARCAADRPGARRNSHSDRGAGYGNPGHACLHNASPFLKLRLL